MKIITTKSFLKEAGNWGKAGSGILFVCPKDQTVMLMFRSPHVYDPHMWGIPGGAVKGTEGHHSGGAHATAFSKEQLWGSAVAESNQEVFGHADPNEMAYDEEEPNDEFTEGIGNVTPHDHVVIYDTNPSNPTSFKYYTFVVEVSKEQKAHMMRAPRNWESTAMQWVPIQQLKGHIKPLPPNTGHPEHPTLGTVHNGVAHVIANHPYFNARSRATKPVPPQT